MHRLLLSMLLLSLEISAQPTTVYKSVDENGQVTFSDQPPASAERAETLVYDTGEPVSAEEAEARLQRMRETTDRMAEDRRQREAARSAARASRPADTPATAQSEPLPVYYPVYYGRRHRPVVRPPFRPPARPPIHPVHPVAPISPVPYPSSYIRKRYPGRAGEIFNPPATGHRPDSPRRP